MCLMEKSFQSSWFQKEMNAFQFCSLKNRIGFDEVCMMCAAVFNKNKNIIYKLIILILNDG